MKRAVYSVEIKVERDETTGQTRVLSSHTKLPVDCSRGGVKVYEDEQKVVHEVNGQDGVRPLSAAEVDELILAADRAADEDVDRRAAEAAEPPSTREMTMASRDHAKAEFGGPRASPREPVAGAPGREAADGTGARTASSPGGGAGPEAATPPPTFAPMPRPDERESVGGAAETKKARECCGVM